jgi:hypothetical protein
MQATLGEWYLKVVSRLKEKKCPKFKSSRASGSLDYKEQGNTMAIRFQIVVDCKDPPKPAQF